jgi:iron complex transport system substrate-binding protein
MPSRIRAALTVLASILSVAPAAAERLSLPSRDPPAHPQRVVSLNLCADELVLRLADRDQIAAVTYLARDRRGSTVSAEARSIPWTRGLSEEIVAVKPDLVIAGAFTTRTTVGMLRRVGFPVLELGVPTDFDGVRAQIRTVASALGHSGRGDAMVADFDARLSAAMPLSPTHLRTLVMRPNAFTVAPGSLGDAILRAAGLVNVAVEIGQDRLGQVPLEAAALADADLLVLDAAQPGSPSLADALLRHPVLGALARQGRSVSIPNRLWTCPGPQIADVVARLTQAARARVER